MATILVVDDDYDILDTVGFLLKDAGFDVETATDGRSMNDQIKRNNPDLILLDVTLHNESGLELAMGLRKTSSIPIIMLTGKSSETDRVVGLELGADDYITKPYSSAELLARIKSVLRRSNMTIKAAVQGKPAVRTFQGFKCDTKLRKLYDSTGKVVQLSFGEFSLLTIFLDNPNRPLSREFLLDNMNKDDSFDRSIDVLIMRLRRKIEADPKRPELILSMRSVGYVFTPTIEDI